MRTRLTALLLGLMATGCNSGLDDYKEVEDLRIIAMRAEPPEVLLDAPAPFDARFDALVLDPRGGEVEYRWSFCPVDSALACSDYETLRDSSAERMRQQAADSAGVFSEADVDLLVTGIDSLRDTQLSGSALPLSEVSTPEPFTWWSQRGVWPYSVDSFQLSAAPDLYYWHLLDNGLNGGLGAWTSAILEVDKPGDAVVAQKRMVLGIRDLAPLAEALAEQFGAKICGQGTPPAAPPDCIEIKPRTANANPVFAGVQFSYGESAIADWLDVTIAPTGDVSGTLHLPVGTPIRILPSFTEASSEAYQVVRIDLQSERLAVDDRVEEISVSWFATYGELQDALTWPLFTRTLDTVYTPPDKTPEGGRDTVWMVARDQRGGTSWMSLEIVISP